MSVTDADISIEDWVQNIREQHPDLPNRLTPEVERSRLDTLEQWRERVRQLRASYEQLPEELIPADFEQLGTGEVVVPATMSIDTMTNEEVQAWHEIFSCVAPQMASKAHKYWKTHNGQDNTLVLGDVLNYLPLVFLYVLSNYDENRSGDNDGEFAEEKGRTRLTTWIEIESRRHIKSYLQSCAYLVGPGSSYLHRLRSQMRKIENEHYAEHGEAPSHEDLVDAVRQNSYYGRSISESALSSRLRELQSGMSVVSTDEKVDNGQGEDDVHFKDVMQSDPTPSDEESKREADIIEYVRNRAENEKRKQACIKVLTSNDPLTVEERFHF